LLRRNKNGVPPARQTNGDAPTCQPLRGGKSDSGATADDQADLPR
jgi:hypothetical protein